MELKKMVTLVSRTGRQLQRYNKGRRLVVGCIPYRFKVNSDASSFSEEEFEVLVISAQRKGKGMLFPKGGWETDESIREAAKRETMEEAGVVGDIKHALGTWTLGKDEDSFKEGYMFSLLVKEQLDFWPEKGFRKRIWMSVPEARKACHQPWMNEALDLLVHHLTSQNIEGQLEYSPLTKTRKSNL